MANKKKNSMILIIMVLAILLAGYLFSPNRNIDGIIDESQTNDCFDMVRNPDGSAIFCDIHQDCNEGELCVKHPTANDGRGYWIGNSISDLTFYQGGLCQKRVGCPW